MPHEQLFVTAKRRGRRSNLSSPQSRRAPSPIGHSLREPLWLIFPDKFGIVELRRALRNRRGSYTGEFLSCRKSEARTKRKSEARTLRLWAKISGFARNKREGSARTDDHFTKFVVNSRRRCRRTRDYPRTALPEYGYSGLFAMAIRYMSYTS